MIDDEDISIKKIDNGFIIKVNYYRKIARDSHVSFPPGELIQETRHCDNLDELTKYIKEIYK